jgi:signal transduction histidine kinase
LQSEIGRMLAMLEIEVAGAHNREPAPELRERLVRARSLVERAMETIRNVSLLLRPALLDDLGLVPALQYQVHEFLRRSGIDCEFSAEGVEEALAENVKTCVYRVVQEALNNCEKHAGASRVRVVLKQEAERLFVEVEDNGRGFEITRQGTGSRNPGLGLLGLRERAARVGGSVVVDSAPGRGTRVSLTIPLPAPSERRAEPAGVVA